MFYLIPGDCQSWVSCQSHGDRGNGTSDKAGRRICNAALLFPVLTFGSADVTSLAGAPNPPQL